MRRRTPQEKKELSYKKDRRNSYGESPHGSRKSIPRRKRLRNRANRRKLEQPLTQASVAITEETAEQIETQMFHQAEKIWSKVPDTPLAEVIAVKQRRRKIITLQGGRKPNKRTPDGTQT